MGLLEELAVRCEAATGADVGLDAEIEIAIHGFPQKAYDQRNAHYPSDRLAFVNEWIGTRYTGSMDAAIKLVPEGLRFYVDNGTIAGETSHACAFAGKYGNINGGCKDAATPALALCASALRARHALALSKGSEG